MEENVRVSVTFRSREIQEMKSHTKIFSFLQCSYKQINISDINTLVVFVFVILKIVELILSFTIL